jgi:fimbrial protein FimY
MRLRHIHWGKERLQGKKAIRAVQKKKRRIRAHARGCPQPHATLMIDSLEHLAHSLNDAVPEGMVSQILISADSFLRYAWSRHLFGGKRIAAFETLDAARYWLDDTHLTTLIVDMESQTTSRFMVLEALRAHCLSTGGLRTYLLISHQDPPMNAFLHAAGPFELLARNGSVPRLRAALLAPTLPDISPRFSAAEWQLITLLARGLTLKEAARQLNMPYHRAVYRISTLLQRLNLPTRQCLTHLLHRLTLDVNH